jgi:hypothetical protein
MSKSPEVLNELTIISSHENLHFVKTKHEV